MPMRAKGILVILVLVTGLTLISRGQRTIAQDQTLPVGHMENVAPGAALDETYRTWSADVADYDKDGWDDFLYVRHDPQAALRSEPLPTPYLYHNNQNGTFTDRNTGFLDGRDRHKCIWGDVDKSGSKDLFCAVGLTTNSRNELRLQKPTSTGTTPSFTRDVAPQHGLAPLNGGGRYRTPEFIDINNDGWRDIYVTRYYGPNNSPTDPTGADELPNEFYLNRGRDADGTWLGYQRDVSNTTGLEQRVGASKYTNNCNQAINYDKDDDKDLLVCGLAKMIVYRNNGNGTFANVAAQIHAGGGWKDGQYADLNGDRYGDLVRIRPGHLQVKLYDPATMKFAEPVLTRDYSQSASAQDVAIGDFNGDTFKDFYLVHSCPEAHKLTDDPDSVFYGDGTGRFIEETIPAIAPRKGCGNTASVINSDGPTKSDPTHEVIVLNGHKLRHGPTQLFKWRPD